MVKVRRIGSAARRMISYRKTPQNTARIARTVCKVRIYGILRGRYCSQLPTAGVPLSTALVSADRVGIRCLAGLSSSI